MNDVSRSQGRTILYVSHNMNTIRQLCTRCIVLDHGKQIFDGEVDKAIEHYMDTAGMTFEKETDLSSASRLKDANRKALFTKVRFQKDTNMYSANETMDMTFSLNATGDYDDVRFMMILFYLDGTRVAKTESGNFSIHKGTNEVSISISCEGLADGQYYWELSLIQRSSSAFRERFDCIPNVLPFTIHNDEIFGVKGMSWHTGYYGHIMLQPIKVLEITPHA